MFWPPQHRQCLARYLAAASLCIGSAAHTAPIAKLQKLGVDVLVPPSLVAQVMEEAKEAAAPGSSQCVKFFFRKGRRYAGEFCASTDPDLLRDKGVVRYESLPQHSRTPEEPASGLVAMSPMAQYPMVPFVHGRIQSFAATTDCDEANGATYRPTSSCHVMAAVLDGRQFFYSSFVVKTNTTGEPRVAIKDIERIWSHLRPR